jgi:hypothetical protein
LIFTKKEKEAKRKKRSEGEACGNCRNYGNPLEKRADSHSCLDKTEQNTCSVLSTVTTGPTAVNKITGNKKTEGSASTLENPFFCPKSGVHLRVPD